jgi:3-keto-5-aminohexanoate cleavage enzyme
MQTPNNKFVITVAQTGGLVTKAQNPAIPEQPAEIAQAALESYNEGGAVIHIHARTPDGTSTGSADVFRDIHARIKAKCPCVIQDSTGGGTNLTIEQRTECLEAYPEMASLNMGTMVRTIGEAAGTVFMNSRKDIEAFVTRMNEFGVKPEMELYNLSMFQEVPGLVNKGLLKIKPYNVSPILGMAYQGALEARPDYFATYMQYLPADSYFNTIGIGGWQMRMATLSIIWGGNCRVGLEDNLYITRGVLARSNAELVAKIVRIGRELGKEPATPAEAREWYGLKPQGNAKKK